ncbi:hypothetical protein ACFQZE_01445 [Paenibacillus sp. GCM10027627]|uniref:hypothetical protein n=1 Tax=unclassified Paenibacillus TaxID=185978 RepID=UPI00363D45C3
METEIKANVNSVQPKSQLLLLIIVLGVALNAAVWFLYAAPAKEKAALAEQSLLLRQQEAETVKGQYTIEKKPDSSAQQLTGRLPERIVESAILQQMTELASGSGVLLASLERQQEIGTEIEGGGTGGGAAAFPGHTITFNLKLAGDLKALLLFMEKLYQYERLYDAKTWSINKVELDEVQRSYPRLLDLMAAKPGQKVFSLHVTVDTFALKAQIQ